MFQPYYAADIRMNIMTEEHHKLFREVMDIADPNELDRVVEDLKTEAAIDPSFERTEGFQIAAKACIRRMSQFKAEGKRPTKWQGEMPSIFEMTEAFMMGVIIGDEFYRRWNSE